MSIIIKKAKKILASAKNEKGKPYLFHPDGKLIPRAKGNIEMNTKNKP